MPRLKDFLKSDLDTFFNIDEFATDHIVDGVEIPIVIDNELIEERQKNSQKYDANIGLHKADLMFAVKKDDFGEKPSVNQNINLDGQIYQVSDVEDEDPLYWISLVANFS